MGTLWRILRKQFAGWGLRFTTNEVGFWVLAIGTVLLLASMVGGR
jgi:hypothetical protein